LNKMFELDNQYSSYKNISVSEIIECYKVINEDLIFPENWVIKIIVLDNMTSIKYLQISYAIHDFEKEFIPVTLYELDSKGNYLSLLDLKMKKDFLLEHYIAKVVKNDRKLINFTPILNSNSINLKNHIEVYYAYIKSNLKDYLKDLEFDTNQPNSILFSSLKVYNDNSNELTSFIHMGLKHKNFEDLITEITINIPNLTKGVSDILSARSFILKDLPEKDYIPYDLLNVIIWGNSFNSNNIGFEIKKFRRSCLLEGSYFNYIYYLEFNNNLSTTNSRIIFGSKPNNEYLVISPISIVSVGRGY